MKDQDSTLDISGILKSDGGSQHCVRSVDLSETDPSFSDVVFEAEFRNISGVVTVRATVSGVYSGVCDRCLEPVSRGLSAGIDTVVTADSSKDDSIAVKDSRIDLVRTAYDALNLELPTVFLCREDCKGLCQSCGANLNEGPCGCGR